MANEVKGAAIRLRGRVAQILTSREVAINLGEDDGVKLGMYFDILHEEGQDIEDPETGETLGNIDRPKVRVKVTHVQGRLSLASTYRKTRVNVGGGGIDLGSSFSKALMPPKWVTRYETIKAEERAWENLKEEDSYVKVGDPVVQALPILDDDDIEPGEQVSQLAGAV